MERSGPENRMSGLTTLQVKDQFITPLDKVRDLGVTIGLTDGELSMDSTSGTSSAAASTSSSWQLRCIRQSLTTDARRTRRLQMVLYASARLVVGAGKFDHVTPVLRDVFHRSRTAHMFCLRNQSIDRFERIVSGRFNLLTASLPFRSTPAPAPLTSSARE